MTSDILKQNFELRQENARLKKEVKRLSNALSYANNRIKQLEGQFENYKKDEEKRIEKIVSAVVEKLNKEHQEEVNKLNAKIKKLESRLNIDSTNSGTPTSKEMIGKHTIQNNREKSEKSKGA